MADRRYRMRSRGRSPSPRCPPSRPRDFSPPSRPRDFSIPSRPRDYSPPSRPRDFTPPSRSRDFSPPSGPRHFSPPSRSRDFSPSRHRKYSPHNRPWRDEYSRRTERDHHFDRDVRVRALKASEYDNRDKQYRSPARIRSPRRIQKRDDFERAQNVRLPNYEDSSKGKYKDGVGSMRPYDAGPYHDGLTCKNFQWDHPLPDGPRKPDHSGGPTRDHNGVGYLGSGRDGLSSVSQYSDRTKTVSLKYEREEKINSHSFTFRHGGVDDIPLGNNLSGADGISHTSSVLSRYLNTGTEKLGFHFEKKKDDLRYQDDEFLLGIGKRNEENLMSRDYVSVTSGILREDFSNYSATRDHSMSQLGSRLDSQPPVFDGIKKMGGQLYTGLYEENKGDELFGGMSTRLNGVKEDYSDQRSLKNDVFKPAVDEGLRKEPTRDDERWGPYPYSQVRYMPDKLDTLGIGRSRLNYGYGSVKNDDNLRLRGYDPCFGRIYDDSPRKTSSGLVDLSLDEPFERRLRNKHARDEMLYKHDGGIRISADGNGARTIYNQSNFAHKIDYPDFSKRAKSNYDETWRGLGDRTNDRPNSSRLHTSRSPNSSRLHTSRSDSRDIKKRLGPAPRKLHVSQRLVKKYKPSIKKRLAPASSKKRATLPWLKNTRSNAMASVQDSDRSGALDLEDQIPLAKPEPPENSEDFKQLVQSAFFKFLKEINETQVKKKMYTKQGKDGSLKCIVCGSNSDEFADTESLARHAFTSQKVGLRSQHLGLHRALCGLMSWKVMEQHSSEWRREVMSDAEASALKEDLIIWPPVVIVYNSTIDNKNHDKQVIVSTEKLDMKLKDMGFGSIVKVCNGKPANQSVMLVKFNGTLSGLGEAERYHNRYAESNRGRAELKMLKSDLNGEMLTHVLSDEREEVFLYGHLGIAEDLDKLDFDTKKRCVLRSKNEILSIVNAPLVT